MAVSFLLAFVPLLQRVARYDRQISFVIRSDSARLQPFAIFFPSTIFLVRFVIVISRPSIHLLLLWFFSPTSS